MIMIIIMIIIIIVIIIIIIVIVIVIVKFGLRFLIFIIVNFPVANYLSFGALYSCSL